MTSSNPVLRAPWEFNLYHAEFNLDHDPNSPKYERANATLAAVFENVKQLQTLKLRPYFVNHDMDAGVLSFHVDGADARTVLNRLMNLCEDEPGVSFSAAPQT